MKNILFVMLLIAAFITGCTDCKKQEQTTPTETTISVDSLTENFISYWNNKDTSALSHVFAPDAVVLLNNGNFVGQDTIFNYWTKEQIIKTQNLKTNKALSETSCKIGYYAGNLKLDFVSDGKVLDTGEITFSLIWKNLNDNTWKIQLLHLATIGDKQQKENNKPDNKTKNK